jgi:FMN phosphatase YigB (HAD superfamily)
MRCQSANQSVEQFQRRAREVDLISFDVFDTLIARRVAPPDQTKVPAARLLVRLLAARGESVEIDAALAARGRVELRLGEATAQTGLDQEARFHDICLHWAREFFDEPQARHVAEQLEAAEVEAELATVYARPGMIEAVRAARLLGKRVVYISDMYLGGEQVRAILDRAGFAGLFDTGYVSSDHRLNKRSGRLFNLVREEEQVPFKRWLHVGDNRWSDYASPALRGIRALRCHDSATERRLDRLGRYARLSRVHPQWRGGQWLELCRQGCSPRSAEDPRYALGFGVLGPVLTAFAHQVLERVRRQGHELVLFPAREGFVLRQLFELLRPRVLDDQAVRSEYAFLNRKTVYQASIDQIGVREISMGLWSAAPTLRTMLARFSLNPEQFVEQARECRLTLDTPIRNPTDDYRFLRFIRHPDLLREARERCREQRALLSDYLGQLGFWEAERVAYVDVGWHGTVQDALTCAFREDRRWPDLWGLYAGFMGCKPYIETPRSHYLGLLYHRGRAPAGSAAGSLCRFVELLEFTARAPHATAIGLRRDAQTGEIVPVLKPEDSPGRQAEQRDRSLIAALQAGVLDFGRAYAETIPFQRGGAEELTRMAMDNFDRLMRLPTADEAMLLRNFINVEDFGTDAVTDHSYGAARWWSPRGWFDLWRRAPHATWAEGLVASRRVPGIVTAANFYRLLKAELY